MGRIPWQTELSDKQLPQLRTASSLHSTCKDVTGISPLTPKFFASHEALRHSSQFKFCGWTSYGSLQAWSTVAAVSIHHLWRFGPKMVLQGLFNKTSGREQRAQITSCSRLWLVTETLSPTVVSAVFARDNGDRSQSAHFLSWKPKWLLPLLILTFPLNKGCELSEGCHAFVKGRGVRLCSHRSKREIDIYDFSVKRWYLLSEGLRTLALILISSLGLNLNAKTEISLQISFTGVRSLQLMSSPVTKKDLKVTYTNASLVANVLEPSSSPI